MARRRKAKKRKAAPARAMDFDPKRFGLAKGILAGVVLFVSAFIGQMSGFVTFMGTNLLPGYGMGSTGAIVGLLYGLIFGVILGGIFAYLYNYLKGRI